MGGQGSTRWRGYIRRLTVEEVERVDARYSLLHGVERVEQPTFHGRTRPRYLCPDCQREVLYLYAAPRGDWLCAACADLSYAARNRTRVRRRVSDPALLLIGEALTLETKLEKYRYMSKAKRRLLARYAAVVQRLEQAISDR